MIDYRFRLNAWDEEETLSKQEQIHYIIWKFIIIYGNHLCDLYTKK